MDSTFADVTEILEAVTGEVKKAQKEEFSARFQKLYDRAKAYIQSVPGGMDKTSGECSLC